MSWTVVEFLDSMTVEAIPTSWLLNNQCYWPPMSMEKIIAEIKKNCLPNTCWPLYNIRVFKDGTYDNYIIARNKAKKAEDTSDLNSETDGKRRIISRKISSSSDSDQSEVSRLPNPPRINITKKINVTEYHDTRKPTNETCNTGLTRVDSVSNSMIGSSKEILSVDFTSEDKICKCCTVHQKKIESYMSEILKKLTLMRANILQLNEDIQNVIKERNAPVEENDNFLNSFEFPISSVECLEVEMNEYLQDGTKFNRAIKDLVKLGGSTTYDFMKRCLQQIITNSLAETYSYYGAKLKRPFKNLKLNQVLLRAAEMHNNSDQKEAEEAIKKWLRRAKERQNTKKNT